MSNLQNLAINFSYLLYNLKPVDVELKEQMPLFENYHNEGDEIQLPMWYAKMVKPRKVLDIKDFQAFDRLFNKTLTDQLVQRTSLIKIPRDFYFLAIDYINSLKNGRHQERKEKLIEFKNMRRKIIIRMIDLAQNQTHKSCDNMSFEELLFYYSVIQAKTQSYSRLDNLMCKDKDEDEE